MQRLSTVRQVAAPLGEPQGSTASEAARLTYYYTESTRHNRWWFLCGASA